jgi:DNA-binding NarL/FixJ family response regulator
MSEQEQERETPIRVLLADDHDILRQGLKLLLGRQPDMQVVGEARTGREAIALAEALAPDVVVMDITMPDIDGLAASRNIRTHQPATQVLMLTMHESEEYFLQALRVGAAGYLVKKAAPTDLQMAIRAVAHGGAFLYPGLAKALVRAYVTEFTTDDEPAEAFQPASVEPSLQSAGASQPAGKSPGMGPQLLTPRELEVLTLVAEGYTSQQIAHRLVVSIKTVQAHRANIMEKLGLRDITHLVRFAIHHGLIPAEF